MHEKGEVSDFYHVCEDRISSGMKAQLTSLVQAATMLREDKLQSKHAALPTHQTLSGPDCIETNNNALGKAHTPCVVGSW